MGQSWQQYSRDNGIELNDQYFLIGCDDHEETRRTMGFLRDNYGFKPINVGSNSLPRGPWVYANLNTRLMFTGNVGINILSGDVIGNHAVTPEEFFMIADIFEKYKGMNLLQFK